MGNFQRDLERGNKVEDVVLKIKAKQHKGLKRVEGKNSGYDLIADEGYTAEVKFDELSAKTGNVGIEFECYGKPSGIEVTIAYEWIHIYKLYSDWVYSEIKPADLKAFLRNNKDYLHTGKGGDYGVSLMHLINVHDFADAFGFKQISST